MAREITPNAATVFATAAINGPAQGSPAIPSF